jgi:hypothetical protein
MSMDSTTAMDLLARMRANAQSPDKQESLAIAIDAVLFITSSGQRYAFEDFRKSLNLDAPPPVVAAFSTRQEADTWLSNHPEPPDSTFVLVADKYHLVMYRRETDLRRLLPDPVIEYYLGRLKRGDLPPAVASFNTREEAEAWLAAQGEPLGQCFITIAGEHHLVVYHRNVNRREIYPFSMAVELKEQSRSG